MATEFEDWIAKKNARRNKKSQPKGNFRKKAPVETTEKNSPNPVRRKRPSRARAKAGFGKEVREASHDRAGHTCENPLCTRSIHQLGGEHHCLPKSQYRGSDRNDIWNCAVLCTECHDRITSPRTDEDKRLRRYFERVAYSRKTYSDGILQSELNSLELALKNNTLDLIRTFSPIYLAK